MSIAKLSIELEARLANFQAGLDKAGVLAEKQAAQIERAFGGLRATAASVGGAFAAIIPAAAIAGIARFVNATTEGLDKLNDLSDATGASVENLSALEDIALRTGTSVDTMGDALVKMNKALADAKPGSDAERAFKALGLSVADLKRLDPVEAFQRLAIALAGYADDGNKARLVQELFGKSLKDVAPLLKDVAEKGKLYATVTKEQAEEAEKYRKSVFELQKNLADLGRTLSGPVVSGFNEMAAAMRAVKAERDKDKGWWQSLNEGLAKKYPQFAFGMKKDEILGTDPSNVRGTFLRGDKDTTPVPRPGLPDITGGTGKPVKPAWSLAAWSADVQKTMDMAFIDANARTNDAQAKDLEKRKEQLAKWTEDMRDENLRLTVGLVEDEKARAKALILLDEQVQMKRLESLQIYGQAYEDAEAIIRQRTELALRGADMVKDKADDVGKEIGLVFSSAAGKAITEFGNLRDVLKGVLADLQQIALRETVTKPLTTWMQDALKGVSIMSLFGSAKGNAFGPGGVIPFAAGGIVNGPTLFKFAAGTGLMGEAGPEAILPLKRGRGGKLGVAGGGMSLTVVNHIDSRTDAAAVAQSVSTGVQAGQQQMLQYLRAQGVV